MQGVAGKAMVGSVTAVIMKENRLSGKTVAITTCVLGRCQHVICHFGSKPTQ